jgi:hypothetical protein
MLKGPNLYKELKLLLQGRDPTRPDPNRIGRQGFLRKYVPPKSKVNVGGEYDATDPMQSEGSDYLDYPIWYYRALASSSQIKDVAGPITLLQDIVYMLAEKGTPQPTNRDRIVQIEHSLDGTPVLVDGEYVMSHKTIGITSIIEFWGDNDGEMVLYVLQPTNPFLTNVPKGLTG